MISDVGHRLTSGSFGDVGGWGGCERGGGG